MVSIDHVAAVVRDLESAKQIFVEGFGFKTGPILENSNLGIRYIFLEGENIKIELIQPITAGPYWEFLEKDLVGFNHIAVGVEDFAPVLERLSRFSVKPKGEALSGPRGSILDLESGTTNGMRIQMFKPKKE